MLRLLDISVDSVTEICTKHFLPGSSDPQRKEHNLHGNIRSILVLMTRTISNVRKII
jgi:hypothetical protein